MGKTEKTKPASSSTDAPEKIKSKQPSCSNTKEIDDIFAAGKLKRAKVQEKRQAEEAAKEREQKRSEAKRRARDVERMETKRRRNNPKPIRVDAESGLPVYTEEALGIGKGGGTPDCPFDCNCCF